ncbi:class E sortase [Streptomyces sp. NPDC046275]|uniref:class E sortase n=1 Tax=Streptomyces sp. NPDC046275 TaxID=3157201 RepID=UPI0033C946CA
MTAGSPWFRATNLPEHAEPGQEHAPGQQPHTPPYEPPYEPIPGQESYEDPAAGYGAPQAPQHPQVPHATQPPPEAFHPDRGTYGEPAPEPGPYAEPYTEPYADPYTEPYAAAPAYEPAGHAPPVAGDPVAVDVPDEDHDPTDAGTMALRTVGETPPPAAPGPGRAERRKAARRKGGRGAAAEPEPPAAATDEPARPLSRVEARRAARAAKDSLGVVLSRAVGELFITFGVVMLLFVTYQLWWTNVRAGQETDRAKQDIENSFNEGDKDPGAFEPGKGFAIMYIPKLDVVVPVAEGINKTQVLDKGMVGHYAEGALKTAMPSDKQGNFAVAGHRNTHGEPFRYINRLEPGDPIVVETRDAYYTYEMASILPQTSPSNVAVIDPVPKGSGFKGPGRYITLTTCTPEFTSTYRMIVWGKLVEERPREKGKPDALVG